MSFIFIELYILKVLIVPKPNKPKHRTIINKNKIGYILPLFAKAKARGNKKDIRLKINRNDKSVIVK